MNLATTFAGRAQRRLKYSGVAFLVVGLIVGFFGGWSWFASERTSTESQDALLRDGTRTEATVSEVQRAGDGSIEVIRVSLLVPNTTGIEGPNTAIAFDDIRITDPTATYAEGDTLMVIYDLATAGKSTFSVRTITEPNLDPRNRSAAVILASVLSAAGLWFAWSGIRRIWKASLWTRLLDSGSAHSYRAAVLRDWNLGRVVVELSGLPQPLGFRPFWLTARAAFWTEEPPELWAATDTKGVATIGLPENGFITRTRKSRNAAQEDRWQSAIHTAFPTPS